MKKGFSILLILILAVAGYLYFHTPAKLTELVIKTKNVSLGSEAEKYTLEENYPAIERGIPVKALEKINTTVAAWANESIEKGKTEFNELLKDPIAVPEYAALSFLLQYKTSYDFSFAPYINIKFENYYYTGGAHGTTLVKTFIFNALTGEQVTFDSIFNENPLEKLSSYALLEIKKIDPELETYTFTEDGLKPMAENFSTPEVTPLGLRFTFGDYQVGPYSAGRPEITVGWSALMPLLKSEFKDALHFSAQ